MLSFELMYEFSELSTMNADPSDSNQTCSRDSNLEQSMAYPILWNFAEEKWSVFDMTTGRIISCLPTGIT